MLEVSTSNVDFYMQKALESAHFFVKHSLSNRKVWRRPVCKNLD